MIAKSTLNKQEKFSFELVNSLLRYDPDTGILFWKERTPAMFANAQHDGVNSAKSFNEINANKPALNYYNDSGYKFGKILGVNFKSHRIAWLLYYGKWPENQIDHINGIKGDNRIENLRIVNNQENSKNKNKSKRNTSGVSGVDFIEKRNKWRVRTCINGKRKLEGYFTTFEEACLIRETKKILYGYTDRHGR